MSKTLRLTVISICSLFASWAVAQNAAVVHKVDGSTVSVPIDQIEKIEYDYNAGSQYEMVDMGVSVNWATVNVDISQPDNKAASTTDYGGYYGWGDETGLHMEQTGNNTRSHFITDINLYISIYGGSELTNISGTTRDIARMKWGGSWRMPTIEEWKELRDNCYYQLAVRNGVHGYLLTSKINGNMLFFPFSGWRIGDYVKDADELARYWSSSLVVSDESKTSCYYMGMASIEPIVMQGQRFCGFSVRPVCDKTK